MNARLPRLGTTLAAALLATPFLTAQVAPQYDSDGALIEPVGVPIAGEVLDPSTMGPSVIESMETVLAREAALPIGPQPARRSRLASQGYWTVPTRKSSYFPHSGQHYATNKWGDTRLGIGFGQTVTLEGAWVAGQGAPNGWAAGLQVVGYANGVEVGRTEWFEDVDDTPSWFAMGLAGVDRIEVLARPVANGAGWYGLDDLTFTPAASGQTVVLNFDDLDWRMKLTGSGYGGLTWENGTGNFQQSGVGVVHPPQSPPGRREQGTASGGSFLGGGGTAPTLGTSFIGPNINDAGAGWLPPDTCGAVGTTQFVSVVNMHMSVYDKASGQRLMQTSLQSFFNTGGNAGDPRVAFDHYSNRWIVLGGDFSSGVRLAVSLTDDATGSWFKTFLNMAQGADAGKWPDYPTLGYDGDGIYTCAYMVGGSNLMSIFALDKAPLIAASPSLGTVTAWRNLAWEGAIQPCVTHGDPGPEYFVSRPGSTQLRLRKVDGPLTSPTMTNLGFVSTPSGPSPPSAPAKGSSPNLSTVGPRPFNAFYRNGFVYTANTISFNNMAACRWYEIDPMSVALNQVGTVSDTSLYYYFPSIAVDANGSIVLGFTGSDANTFPGAYFTGRLAADPVGEMAVPVLYKAGEAAYNGGGGNPQRWGDYSLTSVDPIDDSLWTIQEYGRSNGSWGTWIAQLDFGPIFPSPFTYCTGKINSVGFEPQIGWTGTPSFSVNDFVLEGFHLLPFKNGIMFWGTGQANIPFLGATLCTNPPLARGPIVLSDQFGASSHPITFQLSDVGTTRNWQHWFRDPAIGDGTGAGLSNALEVFIQP